MKAYYKLLLLLLLHFQVFGHKPSLVVIFVIDQFPYSILNKIKPHLTGGLKKLLNKGIVYTNAHHPHAMPATATGHSALSTGCFAKDHGIIGNSWFNKAGKKINCDDDTPEKSAVFKPDGATYNYGKSSYNLVMDTVCDSLVGQSNAQTRNRVYSVSLKSRAAIMTAGKLGKPFWFDENTGNFTTSKAYYKKLPRWVKEFNTQQDLPHLAQFYWKKFFVSNNPYQHIYTENSNYARSSSLLEKLVPIKHSEKEPFEWFMHTPMANKLVFDCALHCLHEKYERTSTDSTMILWVNLSSTDKAGHVYGPDSMEYTDMLYHLDKQLHNFMKQIKQKVPTTQTLFALTSDHGVAPIPEVSSAKGLNAHRILYNDLIPTLNKKIEQLFGLTNLVTNFKTPQLYLNEDLLFAQDKQTKMNIIRTIKQELLTHPGIKQAWSRWELQNSCYNLHHFETYYKNQIYPGRSGYIAVQPYPFSQFTKYAAGTAHRSPYNYNTHIPLILYQKNVHEKKEIHQKVWSLQFAPTLANILNIPSPSGATFNVLQGIIK